MLSLTLVHYVLQVGNALKAQPRIHDNLTAVMSHFLSIVHTMNQRCSSSLEVFFPNLQSSNLANLYWKLVAECCVLLWVPLAVLFNSCIACTYVPSVMKLLVNCIICGRFGVQAIFKLACLCKDELYNFSCKVHLTCLFSKT